MVSKAGAQITRVRLRSRLEGLRTWVPSSRSQKKLKSSQEPGESEGAVGMRLTGTE